MIADIEERLNRATSMQNLLDEIHRVFSWHGTVLSIQMVVDREATSPRVICCVEMADHAQVYGAKIVWGVTPVGDRSFVFNFALNPSLQEQDISNVMLWTDLEVIPVGNSMGTRLFSPEVECLMAA